jgi:hypothetical protein
MMQKGNPMSVVSARSKWTVIAVVVIAVAGMLAFLLTGRDFAAPAKPVPEKRSQPEAKSVPERLQKKPEAKPADTTPPPPTPTETVIIQRPGRGALADVQSADTFMQFDSDRDGVVDRSEARYSDFLTANFDAIDTSRDGKISMDEMRAFDALPAR